METYKYLIKGQPLSYKKAHYTHEAGYTSSKEAQLIWQVTLEGQHQERPLIDQPMEVFFAFFFSDIIKCKHQNAQYKITPTISELIKFASEMATGIVWKDTRLVVKSYAEKHYSKDPRTELTIIRLEL